MADTTVAEEQQDEQHELDTRDSLAAMARRKSARNSADAEHGQQDDAAQSQEQRRYASDATTTQVLPPSFIPTATGRIRPVTGAFPAIQSTSQTEQAQRRRSIQSLAAGSLRRNAPVAGDAANAGDSPTPRIASSAPHYAD